MPRTTAGSRIALRGYGDKAIRFAGTDAYIDFGTTNFAFERTDSWSVSLWVKLEIGQNDQCLMSRAVNTSTLKGWQIRYEHSTRQFSVILASNYAGFANALHVRTNNAMPAGQINEWMHIGFSYNGTSAPGGVVIYKNGTALTTTTVSNSLSASISDAGINARVGTTSDSGEDLTGSVTDVGVATRVWTAAEFASIHFNGVYPSDSLYAQYKFTEGSGTTVADSAGSARNGTLTAGTWITTNTPVAALRSGALQRLALRGYGDKSLQFDGANDYVDLGTTAFNFERTDSFSIVTWINIGGGSSNHVFFSRAAGTPGFRGWWMRYEVASASYNVFLCNDFAGANYLWKRTSSNPAQRGRWRRFGFSYNGTSDAAGLTLYIDGTAVSAATVSNTLSATMVTAGVNARMGTITDDSLDFNGNLTDTAVYSRVLTATEMADIHFSGIYPADNLYARYKFDEGSGVTLADSSGNARNGTITAATWSTAIAPLQLARTVVV